MNIGMTNASSGTIWTISTITRIEVRKRNLKRETATAANNDSSPEISTVPIPTISELRRNVTKPPSSSTN